MISHLRLLRISNLSANLKIQVKLFLNQISVFESSEITAFGIFSINLNLVTSKRKMISYLRLIKISNLSANLKTQVKFFMNQISVFESSELTAFGIFNINLNLVVSILILLVTGLITIIQMKEHPILLQSKENLKKFMQSISKEKLI
ncbi:uncharacterized protein LOC132942794 [Metopolophium dirhodum]|uniref:uncharacterized protein LOC132942794 n=1 Tax=Metopolophium dirhodum TaxID=44670 RepID=UPI00298F59A5|nr:uncharacterized protein LOC132942794 [Metopolophium dirhodum]